MHLALPPGKALEQWQLELTETIGRHIGAALANAERREEHRRLGVLEERGAMARELHDSIAQALAYTQIQVTRLAATLRAEGHGTSSQQVLEELRDGLGNAYRQLRELLATFRLQLGSQGLGATLRETVADFERRSGVTTVLDDRIGDVDLGINQQVHVLQIVREALSNVAHHARARHAAVHLQLLGDRQVEVTVEDDGIGIAARESPRGHFGLTIMRDRAQLLDGDLVVARRPAPAAGTRVRLTFPCGAGLVEAPALAGGV
jgi:two-component system nitrate/nitrite sensor histidine kinase NarX